MGRPILEFMRCAASSGAFAAYGIFKVHSFALALRQSGAPFVRTTRRKLDTLFGDEGLISAALGTTSLKNAHLVDLGSGSGALVRATVRQGGFGSASGVEINPVLAAFSKLRAGPREAYRCEDLWNTDTAEADVVVVYGVPSMMAPLADKLAAECKPGTLVASNVFELPHSKLAPLCASQWLSSAAAARTDADAAWYLYRVGAASHAPFAGCTGHSIGCSGCPHRLRECNTSVRDPALEMLDTLPLYSATDYTWD
jgi:hypothetical protein